MTLFAAIRTFLSYLSLLVLFFTLQACGGGGGGGGGGEVDPNVENTTYSVSSVSPTNGIISPASQTVTVGSSASFNIAPATGYNIDTVSGCNGSLNGNTYTTDAINSDCSITATFSLIPSFSVTTQAGTNGSISAGSTVNLGDVLVITVTPNATFGIDSVTGCNGILNGTTYTTGPITADCQVAASFSYELSPVSPLYDVNGINWNDYVKNDGANTLTATDAAADGTETGGYASIVHGGEFRKMQVTGKSSCTDLTIEDELNAFVWTCINTTNPVSMISTGLKNGKYLSDLIDFDNSVWKSNRVTVFDAGVKYGQSPTEAWWSNPVIEDNDGDNGAGFVSGDIRIVTSNTTAQYIIGQDKVAVVVKPDVTVTSPVSYDPYPGGVIASVSTKYLWIEGSVNSQSSDPIIQSHHGIGLDGVGYSVVRNVQASGCVFGGVSLFVSLNNTSLSRNNYISDISVNGCGYSGLSLANSTDNTIRNFKVIGGNSSGAISINGGSNRNTLSNIDVKDLPTGTGLLLNGGSENYISDLRTMNAQTGVELRNSTGGNVISGVLISNALYGIWYRYGGTNQVVTQATISNSHYGVRVDEASNGNVMISTTSINNYYGLFGGTSYFGVNDVLNTTIMGMVVSNNGAGIRLQSNSDDTAAARYTTIANLVSTDNTNQGVWLERVSNNTFTGHWRIGNNALNTTVVGNCSIPWSGVGFPLPVDFGMNEDCTAAAPSDYNLNQGGSVDSSFVGKVVADDLLNTSDTNGSSDYPAALSVFDAHNFENEFRQWGIDGSTFPNGDHQTRWASGTGRIWDWSLKSTDTVLRNVLTVPTGNDTLTHTWSDATTVTFLRDAVELMGDGIGNENGLCESNETCLYTPNIASYQGHGNLISAGAFVNGTLTDITLMKYSVNGR